MKKYSYFLAILSLLWIAPAQSQSAFWGDINGKPVQETESMKSKNDFAGSVLVTTDEDWREKWDTPPETKPNFNKAGIVPYGKKVLSLLSFQIHRGMTMGIQIFAAT
ncbi:MAG: hypothetical protein M3P47_00375 [Pseudomonadota bacterium]|nr:hypothetical protein [Pseudomonadota bacterium]